MSVRAKKHLGQHFLRDENIAQKIADSLTLEGYEAALEIGPGMGVLTKYLIEKPLKLKVVELDSESVEYLQAHYLKLSGNIISGDFLKENIQNYFDEPYALIGNYPYNISSQILFKALDNKEQIPEIVGMFQKEVAERVAAPHGNKTYGVITVLLQAYYDVEYLFTVHENVFNPPPKVKSAVIRLIRKKDLDLGVPYPLFKRIVKAAFNQRRKTMRNALKSTGLLDKFEGQEFLTKRAEQLSVQDFIEIAKMAV